MNEKISESVRRFIQLYVEEEVSYCAKELRKGNRTFVKDYSIEWNIMFGENNHLFVPDMTKKEKEQTVIIAMAYFDNIDNALGALYHTKIIFQHCELPNGIKE